jgi:hypothetical protein
MRTAFDQALEERALREAAEDYALKRGKPGSPDYDAARLRFRRRIRTLGDLERWEASTRYGRQATH